VVRAVRQRRSARSRQRRSQKPQKLPHLIGVLREAPPALQLRRLASVGHISALARAILQRNVIIVRDEKPLTRCSVPSTVLHAQGTPVDAESWTELDAEVRSGDLNRSGARVVDEALGVRVVVAGGAARRVDNVRASIDTFEPTYTTRISFARMFPLSTCQQRWMPSGDIQVIGREPSLSLVTGDERTTDARNVKSIAARMDVRMLRGCFSCLRISVRRAVDPRS
jgi:hypothetical protein